VALLEKLLFERVVFEIQEGAMTGSVRIVGWGWVRQSFGRTRRCIAEAVGLTEVLIKVREMYQGDLPACARHPPKVACHYARQSNGKDERCP